jgi:pimeloyl-ACP methyl ester carboxylesterase
MSLVGHSLGGRIAWQFAARFPERVDKLVLVAPDGFASGAFRYGNIPRVPRYAQLIRFTLPALVVHLTLRWAYGNRVRPRPTFVRRYRDMLLAPGVRSALPARMTQIALSDPVPVLRRIAAPTLLLWGQVDRVISPSHAVDFAAVIPNSAIISFPGVGHMPQDEAPEESLEAVLDFLESPPGIRAPEWMARTDQVSSAAAP